MPAAPGQKPPWLTDHSKNWEKHPLIERYKREYVDFHQLTDAEWRARRRILLTFWHQLQADGRDLMAMTGEDLQTYGGGRLADGRHVNTVRFEMNRIRWFASYLYGLGLLSADQLLALRAVRNPRGSTGKAQPRPYSREDLDRFYALLDERWPKLPQRVLNRNEQTSLTKASVERWLLKGLGWRHIYRHATRLQVEAIVALALHCGLRAGEIFTLDLDRMEPSLDFLVVKAKRSDQREKLREVPYTPPARDAVREWLGFRAQLVLPHQSPWLRLRREQKYVATAMDRPDMYSYLTRRMDKEWRLHRFRHTAATERLRAGTEIEIISEWLGHSGIQTTLGYLGIVSQDIANSMARSEAEFVKRVSRKAA